MKKWIILPVACLTMVVFLSGCNQELKQENEQLKKQVSSLTGENEALNGKVASLEKEIENIKSQAAGFRTERDNIKNELETLKKTTSAPAKKASKKKKTR